MPGLGNAVVGTANRIYNSNGSLIFGAGNEITNSITDIDASAITPTAFGGPSSVTKLSETVRNLVKDNKSGGSTLAIGGGNKADNTIDIGVVTQAVQKGVFVDTRLTTEFAPELALFCVDTIKQDKNGKPKIERVRVNHKR